MAITSNYWSLSETLLTGLLPIVLIISSIIMFVLIGVYFNHTIRILRYIIFGVIILNAVVFLYILNYTRAYRNLEKNVTYKNREYNPSVLGRVSYSNMDISHYSQEDIDKTNQLPFYSIEENRIEDRLIYLGKDDDLYFFKDDQKDQVYHVDTTSDIVDFSSNLGSNVVVETKNAKLNDPSFIEIGFKKKVGPTIIKILINKKFKDTYYRHDAPTKIFE